VQLPDEIRTFVRASTGNYGKVKLVLQRNKFFVESAFPDVLARLLKARAGAAHTLPHPGPARHCSAARVPAAQRGVRRAWGRGSGGSRACPCAVRWHARGCTDAQQGGARTGAAGGASRTPSSGGAVGRTLGRAGPRHPVIRAPPGGAGGSRRTPSSSRPA